MKKQGRSDEPEFICLEGYTDSLISTNFLMPKMKGNLASSKFCEMREQVKVKIKIALAILCKFLIIILFFFLFSSLAKRP